MPRSKHSKNNETNPGTSIRVLQAKGSRRISPSATGSIKDLTIVTTAAKRKKTPRSDRTIARGLTAKDYGLVRFTILIQFHNLLPSTPRGTWNESVAVVGRAASVLESVKNSAYPRRVVGLARKSRRRIVGWKVVREVKRVSDARGDESVPKHAAATYGSHISERKSRFHSRAVIMRGRSLLFRGSHYNRRSNFRHPDELGTLLHYIYNENISVHRW